MTELWYQTDSNRRELEATVQALDGQAVALSGTVFYMSKGKINKRLVIALER